MPRQRRQKFSGVPIGPGSGLVEFGGMLIPPGGDFEYAGSDDEPDLFVSVRIEDGQPYLSEFRLTSRDARSQITDADLRIATSQAAEDWTKWIVGNLPAWQPTSDGGAVPSARTSLEYIELRSEVGRRRRRASAAERDRQLAEVARIYRDNLPAGTKAVAEQLGLNRKTAELRISQARKAGHLGPALKGKAGEA